MIKRKFNKKYLRQSQFIDYDQEFEKYRQTLLILYGIDLNLISLNKLQGGKADNMRIQQIINIPLEQIIDGIEIQMEHTYSPEIALQIALDHLYGENKQYYTYLKQMQQQYKDNTDFEFQVIETKRKI